MSLERAEKDAETLDWLSIPADQRIIDDKTLEWVADVPGLFGIDDKLECEEKENMEPEPKRTKLENCSPVANVKDKRFMDLTGSPELASCSKGYVPPNTQANTQWSVKTFNSWMDWRIKAKLEARLRFGSGFMFSFSSHSSSSSVPNKPGTSATHSRDLSSIMHYCASIWHMALVAM